MHEYLQSLIAHQNHGKYTWQSFSERFIYLESQMENKDLFILPTFTAITTNYRASGHLQQQVPFHVCLSLLVAAGMYYYFNEYTFHIDQHSLNNIDGTTGPFGK